MAASAFALNTSMTAAELTPGGQRAKKVGGWGGKTLLSLLFLSILSPLPEETARCWSGGEGWGEMAMGYWDGDGDMGWRWGQSYISQCQAELLGEEWGGTREEKDIKMFIRSGVTDIPSGSRNPRRTKGCICKSIKINVEGRRRNILT